MQLVTRLRLKTLSACAVVWLCAGAAAMWVMGACDEAYGQRGAAAEYRAYALQHKSPADVEKVLSEMLSGMDDSLHVVADAKANQVLVRGSEKVQQAAGQLIASMDRPAAAASEAKPLVKSYPCPGERQAEVLGRLRSAYAQRGDVRAAVDPQGGAVIVLGPAEAHAEIAAWLASPAEPRRAAEPASAPDRGADEPQFVAIRNAPLGEVEARVRELFRERLVPQGERKPGIREYRYAGAKGRAVELAFDRTRNGVAIVGSGPAAAQWVRLIRGLDVSPQADDRSTEVVPLHYAHPQKVREAVDAYRNGNGGTPPDRRLVPRSNQQGRVLQHGVIEQVSYWFQPRAEAGAGEMGSPPAPPGEPRDGEPRDAEPREIVPRQAGPGAAEAGKEDDEDPLRRLREMGLEVNIETLPDLDAIILRGRKRDVDELKRIIQEVERLSAETEPMIDIYFLQQVQGSAISAVIRQVQADVLAGRQGRVTILPLGKPNALLLIGWGEAVKKARELIAKLDQPADPQSHQRVYRLRHASAATVATTLTQFFAGSTASGLQPTVKITPDPRTNSLVVHAAPRELGEIEALLEKLDTTESATVFRTRVFKLNNTLAADIAATLQSAIDAARGGGTAGQKSAALELLAVDPNDTKRERLLRSGILNDVRVTPDSRLNILVVAAPPENMDLLAALIKELDSPGAVAQIKVFRITNSDANAMVQMLRGLLPTQLGAGGAQLAAAEGEPSTMGLRFSTDPRTNSILAIGSTGDLRIVEALILRLDALDVQQRKTVVYRLKNAPAPDVAGAVNRFLTSERQVQLAAPGTLSPFQQLESEVVVVPEPVSNALIISATPRFFQEINELVEKLDAQPSQVMIQVLIAEVSLRDTDELGVELGLQDSVLFDRSVLAGNMVTQTNSTQQSTPSGIITQTEQSFPAATLTPGYLFNNPILGNGGTKNSLQNSNRVGGQGLSSLGVARINNELGFGGMVLSASSESISVLIRALQESSRLEVLGRPHIMTLDNQSAFIQIGKRVPRITGSMAPTLGTGQVFNTFELVNVGLILGVTPRISPEGMVVMEIDAEKSELGPESEGIPVTISEGAVIRSPTFNTTMAQTTVSAGNGETIVLGGLITKNTAQTDRKVPYLGDIPVVGNLFKYHFTQCKRTELLIVLTPHVVRDQQEADRIKRIESARMHWCLDAVQEIHGAAGLSKAGLYGEVVYPDSNPRGEPAGESPSGAPDGAAPPEAAPNPLRHDAAAAPLNDRGPAAPPNKPPTVYGPPPPPLPRSPAPPDPSRPE